ncbi:MAG TPA: carboxypeptidase regulatory-like domain-containing protein [Vicinamibacterales bacterium]|nr:carboxypeptidase regulatory-like domain-containing protein [Vicinamibacterales bacterium]
MSTIILRRCAACVLCAVIWGAPSRAHAQATGAIAGLVTDPSGGALPGASIEVVSRDTGQVRTAVTGADGFFTVPLVNPGLYRVTATLSGFRTTARETVTVVVNETVRADLQMQLAGITETLVISAESPLVETTNATLGVVIDRRKVVDLPLNGRNFTQLGTLIPGVVAPPSALGGQDGNATPGGFGNATGGFNVNGQRNQSNNFLLDGASNNDSFNTGFVLRPPPDAIQEFKILTHSYDAEYGRNAGSVVNVVTKGGTNEWHGSAWEFNRDDRRQATNFFATTKPELQQNQYGGAIGGPLVRNRLFMFSYYEGFQNKQGVTDTRTVLSAAQRGGDFSGGAPIRNPVTGLPIPNNVIPPELISPISQRILAQYIPLPNSTANRSVRSPNVEDTREQFGTRVDIRLNPEHTLLGRYIVGHTNNVNPLGGSNFSPAGNTAIATLQDVMGSDSWLIRSNMINVARASVNRIDAKPTVTSGLNLSDLGWQITPSNPTAAGLPFITVTGFFTTGDAQQPFATRVNNVLTFTDDLSWVSGVHAFKFGGEIRRDQIRVSFINRPNGDFTFSGQYTGSAAADFLIGFPQQYRQATGDPNLDGSSWVYAIYGQDEFRLSRVTLNYGLRYEVNQPFAETQDHLNAFHPGQQSMVFPNAPTGLVYPGDTGVPRGTYPTDTNNFAPRLSAVWDVRGDGRTAVRGAWGVFYDTLPGQGDFFQNGTLAPPFQPLTEVNYPLAMTSSPFANPLAGVTGTPGFPPGLIFIGWGPEFETPVVQQYNVTLQQQVGAYWGLEAGYVGSRGKHLPIFMEVNPTIPILSPAPAIGPRIFPAYSLVRPTFSVAQAWYDSLQASARMRPWFGLNVLASYTLGHAVDHVSGLNIGGESRPMLPVTIGDDGSIEAALAREKGDALFDVRHRVVLSFGYELPRLADRSAAVRLALGGWQVNGIVQGQTGFPLTVIEPNNVSLTSLTNRPNLTCDPNEGAAHTVQQWFNTSCFQRLTVAANAGQIGNEPRDPVRGPGFSRTDLSFFKNFAIAGSQQAQLRVEAFNIFNQERFGPPNGTIGAPTFGQITAADDGRIVQLGLKYTF